MTSSSAHRRCWAAKAPVTGWSRAGHGRVITGQEQAKRAPGTGEDAGWWASPRWLGHTMRCSWPCCCRLRTSGCTPARRSCRWARTAPGGVPWAALWSRRPRRCCCGRSWSGCTSTFVSTRSGTGPSISSSWADRRADLQDRHDPCAGRARGQGTRCGDGVPVSGASRGAWIPGEARRGRGRSTPRRAGRGSRAPPPAPNSA